jgi:hypothetical protein
MYLYTNLHSGRHTGSCEKRLSFPNEMLYYNAAKNYGAGPEREQADVLQVTLENNNTNNDMSRWFPA